MKSVNAVESLMRQEIMMDKTVVILGNEVGASSDNTTNLQQYAYVEGCFRHLVNPCHEEPVKTTGYWKMPFKKQSEV